MGRQLADPVSPSKGRSILAMSRAECAPIKFFRRALTPRPSSFPGENLCKATINPIGNFVFSISEEFYAVLAKNALRLHCVETVGAPLPLCYMLPFKA